MKIEWKREIREFVTVGIPCLIVLFGITGFLTYLLIEIARCFSTGIC